MIKKIFFAAVLLVCSQAAMAENVLYAQVEGTDMTLKYGEKPADTETIKYYEFDGTAGWNGTFYGVITTATVDASCSSYDGTSLQSLFDGFSKLTVINDIGKLNTDNVEDMNNMFANCSLLTTLDLHTFNTAKVTNMSMMFYHCSGLTSLRVSIWNTANVTNMNQMFDGCSSLTTLNLGAWNTAKVTNMTSMFQGCSALVAILVGPEWNTDAVTSSEYMFYQCTNIKGSDGVTYDPSKLDKTYARISDGGANKGYMTGGMLKTQLAEGRRWATWCCSDDRTYVIDEDEDANAYAAEYDAENSRLILHKIGNGKVIPANNVVIIVADKDNENIIMNIDDAAQAEMPTNHLSARKYHEDLSYEGDIYVLGMVNGKFGFHKFDKNFYLPFYKAFLHIPSSSTGGSARAITFSFADDITGVETIDNGQLTIDNYAGADVWYTINGVKLSGKPTAPGMYINSGKKIIIK
ncbi:MAG: DUF285 domain-containing protein [Prevotella sp.]|nr:DUF285 domain-containing protein [Prevotella sp.]